MFKFILGTRDHPLSNPVQAHRRLFLTIDGYHPAVLQGMVSNPKTKMTRYLDVSEGEYKT